MTAASPAVRTSYFPSLRESDMKTDMQRDRQSLAGHREFILGPVDLCCESAWGRHVLFTSSQPAYSGSSADTVHLPDEGAGALCLSSDMFSTCNARANRQISL